MSNYCVICGVEIPEGRQVCPCCINEVMKPTNFNGLVAMLRNGLDVELVDIFVEDESIRLTIPPNTLLSAIDGGYDFINDYIFFGPIKSVKLNRDRIEVIL